MSSDIAIDVQNLSKCYQIYSSPRDRLKQFVLPRLSGNKETKYFREFWALKDVGFQVRKGETVGIIGRNGSGKSTLLQMICGTLNPSAGDVKVNGKIAALLELGAGFNPEFTGRENVYMAASLYGLSRDVIAERFESIAAFADIGGHIEQPVKNYSSGMYVRLAFAVITHVDADILVIDEALAVGDAVFTQKCMRFIRSFKEKGTLLFVSHDMNSVLNLCQNAIWLDKGIIRDTGTAKEIAELYLQYTLQEVYGDEAELGSIQRQKNCEPKKSLAKSIKQTKNEKAILDYQSKFDITDNLSAANGWKTGSAEILAVEIENLTDVGQSVFKGGEKVRLTIKAMAHERLERPILGFLLRDRLGQDIFGENTLPFTQLKSMTVKGGGKFKAEYEFNLPMLPNGQYSLMASLADGDLYNNVQHHWLHDSLIINVSSSQIRWGLVGLQFSYIDLKHIK